MGADMTAIYGVVACYRDISKAWGASLFKIERLVSTTMAQIFFSSNQLLGRMLLLVVGIFAPRVAAFGIIGLLAVEWSSGFFSGNEKLRRDGLFALNGIFLGFACSSFFPTNGIAFVAIVGLALVCGLFVVIFDRCLRVWNLPLMVMPYVSAMWCLQAISQLNPELSFAMDPFTPNGTEFFPMMNSVLGAIKGYGQIFFQDNLPLSFAILTVLSLFSSLSFGSLLSIPIGSAILSRLVVGPHWAVDSGLCSFAGILIWAAFKANTISPRLRQMLVLIAVSGPIELISIHVMKVFGLFSLSFGYVLVVWGGKLAEETQKISTTESKATMPW